MNASGYYQWISTPFTPIVWYKGPTCEVCKQRKAIGRHVMTQMLVCEPCYKDIIAPVAAETKENE